MSLLIEAIGYQGDIRMPPAGKLRDDQIAALTNWIKSGAPWPGGSFELDKAVNPVFKLLAQTTYTGVSQGMCR